MSKKAKNTKNTDNRPVFTMGDLNSSLWLLDSRFTLFDNAIDIYLYCELYVTTARNRYIVSRLTTDQYNLWSECLYIVTKYAPPYQLTHEFTEYILLFNRVFMPAYPRYLNEAADHAARLLQVDIALELFDLNHA